MQFLNTPLNIPAQSLLVSLPIWYNRASLCVDEKVVPFKGHSRLKQYNKSKPPKWVYKIWVPSGKSGFAYDKEGDENHVLTGKRDWGTSSNDVMHLAKTIPPVGHKLYFDNYFTSINLIIYLEQQATQRVGTGRVNRLQGLSPKTDKDLKKTGMRIQGQVHN